MAKKFFLLIAFSLFSQAIISQAKTCETPGDDLMDLNSITKCTIEKVDKTDSASKAKSAQTVKIQVTSRRRVVRKRSAVSGVSGNTAAKKIASIKEKAALVGTLDLSNNDVLENVPFTLVEEVPLFKGCTKVPISQQEKCFKDEMTKHVRKNFRYPPRAYEESIQGKVFAQFIINELGEVTNITMRGPYSGDLLESETERIIKKLPKFSPGKHNGNAVKVKYGIPITFKIPGKKPTNVKPPKKMVKLDDVIGFADVDLVPAFPECGKAKTDEALTCFNREIINHVNKYFAYPQVAVDRNIEGKVYASFVIDKEGDVVNVEAKGPNGTEILENAATRLFEKLPKFKPGLKGGKPVNVKYTFPIDFTLN